MSHLITIRESSFDNPTFQLTLSFDNGPDYEVNLTNPANQEQEARFGWYFERYLRYPMLDTVKAEQIVEEIRTYGEGLFNALFQQREAFAEYQSMKKAGLSQLEFAIIGKSPRFQAIHWEALKDPALPEAFAAGQANVFRKNSRPAGTFVPPAPSPVLNLLMVVARPDWENDVNYRTITRPIIDLIDTARLRVEPYILRPGTYEQLLRHLDDKPAGFYHIIHFDTHGALLDYANYKRLLDEQASHNPYLMQARLGVRDLPSYTGKQAFLIFEGDEKGKSVPISAQELADLLTARHIPICLLNACQSAKEAEEDYQTSLAAKLMDAGVQAVLGQSYSITVTAAEVLMKQLYQTLYANANLNRAIAQGRRELVVNKRRRAYFSQSVDLEDWLLPVYYQNRPVKLDLTTLTAEEEELYYRRREAIYRPQKQPFYGFVGRDLDILTIEKRLLKHNMLLLRGMGGTGKTTLLEYLAQWWERTGWVKKTFYFGYDKQAYTLHQILDEIARQVFDRFAYAQFQASSPVVQRSKVVDLLTTKAYCLMLDNCESITGTQLAILHTLTASEQAELRDFLARLRQEPGRAIKSYVLIGSRSDEGWLAPTTFDRNTHQLAGRDAEARTTLARRILERETITQAFRDPDFGKLMNLLAGYPLVMEVILPILRRKTAANVIDDLNAGHIDLSSNDGSDKTSSILLCVDYSHSNLSPEAQRVLLCLAPFSGYISLFMLEHYFEALRQQAPFRQDSFANWRSIIDEAVKWGLLQPALNDMVLQLQPVFPYFLQQKVEPDMKPALETAFRFYYDQWANQIYQLLNAKEPQEKQFGGLLADVEYENIYKALQLSLNSYQSIINPYRCLSKYIDTLHNETMGLALAQLVLSQLDRYPTETLEGPIGNELIGVTDDVAKRFLLTQQYEQANKAYENVLKLLQSSPLLSAAEAKKMSSRTYHQLGIVAQEQRLWEQAEGYYQQALAIFVEFKDRYEQARTYHQLGMVAEEQRLWEQAEGYYQQAQGYYQQALAIFVEYGDKHNAQIVRNSLQRLANERNGSSD